MAEYLATISQGDPIKNVQWHRGRSNMCVKYYYVDVKADREFANLKQIPRKSIVVKENSINSATTGIIKRQLRHLYGTKFHKRNCILLIRVSELDDAFDVRLYVPDLQLTGCRVSFCFSNDSWFPWFMDEEKCPTSRKVREAC